MHARRINAVARRVPPVTIYLLGVLWAGWAFWQAASGAWIDPVAELQQRAGRLALLVLLLVLAVTPLRRLFGINLLRLRRALGVTAFLLALYHVAVWVMLDMGAIMPALADVVARPYLTLGAAALLLLVPLALTANDAALRWLGAPRWRQLHRLIYPALALACLHFVATRKNWQIEPLLYLVFASGLLLLRLAPRRGRTATSARAAG